MKKMNLTLKKVVAGILMMTSIEAQAQDAAETRTPVDKLYQAFVRVADLPAELRSADPRIENMPRESFYAMTVGLVNDNYVMGYKQGDDLGLTHGVELKVQKYLENGAIYSLRYDEILFSEKTGRTLKNADGQDLREQRIVTEKILELMYSTANKGRLFFYEVGAGWHRLDPNPSTFASTTQEKWHELVLRKHQVVSLKGPIDEEGVMVEGAIGLMKIKNLGPIETDYQVKLGGRYSGVPKASYTQATGEAGAKYNFSGSLGVRTVIGVNVMAHSEGQQIDYFLGLEIVGKKFSCGVKAVQPTGDVMNYAGLNTVNKKTGDFDMIGTTFCQKKF